jgi:hypothetical protein
VTYSRRNSRRGARGLPNGGSDEQLLTSLRELLAHMDPLPEHVAAVARSALSAAASRTEERLTNQALSERDAGRHLQPFKGADARDGNLPSKSSTPANTSGL